MKTDDFPIGTKIMADPLRNRWGQHVKMGADKWLDLDREQYISDSDLASGDGLFSSHCEHDLIERGTEFFVPGYGHNDNVHTECRLCGLVVISMPTITVGDFEPVFPYSENSIKTVALSATGK